jgi:glycosyltransferase involved in cell wall biosynthesis
MKIAVVVHGRFFAFELARALLARGHDVTVFTNYPRWAAARFGLPPARVRAHPVHGAMTRLAWRARDWSRRAYPEAALHRLFGRWAASRVAREDWDVLLPWSGVAEEALSTLRGRGTLRLLVRGSTHVRSQARILQEEAVRTGADVDRPSDWMVAREEREYGLADGVVVLSRFCRDTFIAEGYPPDRVHVLPLGVRADMFRAAPEDLNGRVRRLLSGAPIRVLNVGAFSLRKGMWDVPRIVRRIRGRSITFRFVGVIAPDARAIARSLRGSVAFASPVPERELPAVYAQGDVFLLPTLEEGFPAVLAQARAAGLPILTTPNGAGAEVVREGETGWVLPPRDPDAFAQRLIWCDEHRESLAAIVQHAWRASASRDWADVASDLERACAAWAVRSERLGAVRA